MPETPRRLKRAESFLGIHFDFHAGDDNFEIGKYTTPEMIAEVIQKVQPDYIQCDCKGHRGFSSYPTKVGYPAPGIVADGLKVWREATAAEGIALYMHYSGVWDNEAVLHHPEWALVNPDGKRDPGQTSTLGSYVDELLIPQLKELCDVYGVDGVWVDGDCWATKPDYSPQGLAAFRAATGLKDVPRKAGDPGWFEFKEFFREAFRRYVRHYTDELHRHNPNFQVASNWAFSSFVPEPVSANVDYISGDYTLQNSLNSARLEGRCMARQGKPWDLMAWGFSSKIFSANPADDEPAFCSKTALQLQQEAAVVLALGGGFQAYFTQRRDGAVRLYQMDVMAEVARFARQRQAYCHHAEAVPQVALLHSSTDYYRRNDNLFAPGELLYSLRGTLQALLDNQVSVEVLSEHYLKGRLSEYGLVVVPEIESLEPAFRAELLDYARGGGSLLIVGGKTAKLFSPELGVEMEGALEEKTQRYLGFNGKMIGLSKIAVQPVWAHEDTKPLGRLHLDNDSVLPSDPAATIAPLGKGWIAGIYFSFGERYLRGQTALARDFLGALVKELFPTPMVEVRGSHGVDVVLNRKDRRLALNLVNTSGPHADWNVYTYDEVPPSGPLEILLRLPAQPRQVLIQPGDRQVEWTYRDGELRLALPSVAIHDIVWIAES
jgi:hypothetical protein